MFEFTLIDWKVLAPVLVLAAGALAVLAGDLLYRDTAHKQRVLVLLSAVSLVVALVWTVYQYSPATSKRSEWVAGMGPALASAWSFRMETVIGALVLEVLTLLTLLSSASFLSEEDRPHVGEYLVLLQLFPVGGILLISAKHLMLAFLGLELLSISLYVLVAIRRTRYSSVEAGLKYFLLGAFAAATFLYGAALIYAGNGTLSVLGLDSVNRPGIEPPRGFAAIGGGFLFVALFFKASVAPFHMWTPDVYQGAPTPITGLMSTGSKAAAFLLLMAAAPLIPRQLLIVLPPLTVLTILVGNFGALVQSDIKRLIAYSGIAHAGYLLIAYSALCMGEGPQDAAVSIRAILFYLAAYGVTNLAALAVIAYLEATDPRVVELEGLKGLWHRNPACAAVLAIAMLSLAGIPPTVGFWGKYLVFAAAIHAKLPILAIVGILFSVVGLYYYLKVVVYVFFRPAEHEQPIAATGFSGVLAISFSGAAVLLLGLLPGLLLDTLVHVML